MSIYTINGRDLTDFADYCMRFYGPRSNLYPMKPCLGKRELAKAIRMRLNETGTGGFEGDTIDRERVRDIILANRTKS